VGQGWEILGDGLGGSGSGLTERKILTEAEPINI